MAPKYLYGVIREAGPVIFGAIGLETGHEPVYAVGEGGIAAVVSDYRGLPLDKLERHEKLQQLVIHQRVIETVMKHHTVLPAKFGTVLPSAAELRRAIRCGRHELTEALDRLGGLEQYEVAATWDLGPVFAAIAAEPAISEARAAAMSAPAAESEMMRLRVGMAVSASLDRKRDELRDRAIATLAEEAIDHQVNAVMGDEMVMNVAFLLRESSRDALMDRLHWLDADLGGKLNFRCVGPLPPYSFGTVEITRPDPGDVDAALDLLGLGERISLADVRKAYRERAAKFHPDVNPSPDADEVFSRLRAAERLLAACYAARTGGDGIPKEGSRVIGRAQAAKSYLVAVRRVEQQA